MCHLPILTLSLSSAPTLVQQIHERAAPARFSMADEGNDIEEGEVVEFQEGTSTSFGAMFNIVNLLLGVGALSLPYSVRIEGGVLRAS